jgi:hypothetical protein
MFERLPFCFVVNTDPRPSGLRPAVGPSDTLG